MPRLRQVMVLLSLALALLNVKIPTPKEVYTPKNIETLFDFQSRFTKVSENYP